MTIWLGVGRFVYKTFHVSKFLVHASREGEDLNKKLFLFGSNEAQTHGMPRGAKMCPQ